MNAWINTHAINMAVLLSEDVGAPELRNPKVSAIRHRERKLFWFFRKGR